MRIQAVRDMIAQIYTDLNLRIIKGNTTNPKPNDQCYGVYNITAPYIKESSRGAVTQVTTEEGTFEKRSEEYRFTISFNIYASDYETAMESAFALHQWFLFIGEDFLDQQDLVPVIVGNIQNRTSFLVDAYEYKCGFDVQIRTSHEQIKYKPIEIIESIEI